nr:MAG TPA: putative RNA ligase [Caudoviricetes sp.]
MLINNKRALAYTAKCGTIEKINGADNIELVSILGWKVIAKIGEFHEGDLCVYFEIDSKLPEKDWSAFMASKHYKVKTMKLGKFGVISQGLALPISVFDVDIPNKENIDLTDVLGVTYAVEEDNVRKSNGDPDAKYKSMAARHRKIFKQKWARWLMRRSWGRKVMFFFFGKKKDKPLAFPTHFPFIHKTDEERCENLVNVVLGYERPLIVTEKLDGTSSTYILERLGKKKFEFYVLSRNVRQRTPDQECYHDKNIYWEMAFKYDIEQHLKDYLNENPELKYVCIQGESVGSVQGNPLKLKEDDLYVFNFIRSDVGRLSSVDGKNIVEQWNMKWVPILDTNYMMPTDMEEFKQFATAKSVVNPNVLREGIVLRDPTNDFSFKNVSREYLLKHNG